MLNYIGITTANTDMGDITGPCYIVTGGLGAMSYIVTGDPHTFSCRVHYFNNMTVFGYSVHNDAPMQEV